ncbi:protein C2-DOMAIN ABA-RELATED 4-like [Cucurbita pepo subsp. pepo]|uniref:protein C2-DOMAIN ABA-RELATED 4-like n=1 Tax=Cucurbita pepo subsp. pepo TaxID=3664 RepID=UPI000C9D3917|nr:protein C2-DOMAIN ABA-RELATED 4-like [Cucurbita pepo subsp. pepo]
MAGSPKSPECGGEGAQPSSSLMDSLLGLLRVRVIRGVNLAVRDVRSSDPYIVVKMSKQKLKTRVIKKDINPEWNEDLTLSVIEPNATVKLTVYDHDTFSMDDKMGVAEFEIGPFIEALQMNLAEVPSGTVVSRVQPSRQNCLAEESTIVWEDGKVVQNICLRLRNVERGEVEIQLLWIDLPGSKAALTTCSKTWMELSGYTTVEPGKEKERLQKIPAKTKKAWGPTWRVPGVANYVNRFKSTLLLQRCLYKK